MEGTNIGGHNLRSRAHKPNHYRTYTVESDSDDSLDSLSDHELDSNIDTETNSLEQDFMQEHAPPGHTRSHSPTRHRNTGRTNPLQPKKQQKEDEDDTIRPTKGLFPPIARWSIVAFILVSLLAYRYAPNYDILNRCANGLSAPAQDLRRELLESSNFPPSFDLREFVAIFKHRHIGRPTVIHLVSTSEHVPRHALGWLTGKQPCAGFTQILANHADFMGQAGSFAKKYHSIPTDTGACRVFFTVVLKNAQFDKTNRDWLESVIDDTRPFAYTRHGNVDTNDWCVILLDHWTEELGGESISTWSNLDPATVQQRIRDITAPLWSTRFYQRIQAIFFL